LEQPKNNSADADTQASVGVENIDSKK